MKKLLSILSTTALLASAPLVVVSCQNTESNQEANDYKEQYHNFTNDLEAIFRSNMEKQFSELQILNAVEAKEKFDGFDIEYLLEVIKSNPKDPREYQLKPNSKEFLKQTEFFKKEPNFSNFQKEILELVKKDPDYNRFIISNKNAFDGIVNLEEITLTDNSIGQDKKRVEVKFEISTNVFFLNLNHKETFETLHYSNTISIFDDIDMTEEVNAIKEELKKQITSVENANKFKIESNSANIYKTASQINELTNFKEVFNSDIKNKLINKPSLDFDLSEVKYQNEEKYTILADLVAPIDIPFNWSEADEKVQLMKAALKNGGNDLDKLVVEHSQRGSIFNANPNYPDLAEYLTEDLESSELINQYHLWEHYKRGTKTADFRKIVTNEGIDLDKGHETQEQKRTIGLFGTKISGLKLVYKNELGLNTEFMMPELFIVNRQLTTFSNTQDLHNEYTKANLIFMREAYGFTQRDSSVNETNFDYTFEFKTPTSLVNQLEADKFYNTKEIFNQVFDETINKLEAQKASYNISSFTDYINGYQFLSNAEKFKINDLGYIFFYNKNEELIKSVQLSQSYGTADLNWGFQGAISLNINAGVRDDITITEFNQQATPWKIK